VIRLFVCSTPRRGLRAAVICTTFLAVLAYAGEPMSIAANASISARDRCQRLMHEDADAFGRCMDQLLRVARDRTVAQRYSKLGIAYYAWLSATAAAKNGLPTAEETAIHFLRIFRPLQTGLGVSDEALCKTIPGDCAARIARLRVMENESPPEER
jgi:hypothetical protein